MVTGLLRPDAGRVVVHGVDVWAEPVRAKHIIGVLPDQLRLFDRLTGAQLLYYSGNAARARAPRPSAPAPPTSPPPSASRTRSTASSPTTRPA